MPKTLTLIVLTAAAVLLTQTLGCGPESSTPSTTKPAAAVPDPKATPTPKATPAATKDGWKQSYKADFSGDKLPKQWELIGGTAKLDKGVLVLVADTDSAELVLKEPLFPAASVRVEFTGSFAAGEALCDMSPILNTDKEGFPNGYMFQFGAGNNLQNRIRKGEDVIEETVNTKLLPLKAGQKYTIVAENDKGHLKMTVNGQVIFDYQDAKPTSGAKNGMIGFYTWQSQLRIENLTVYEKP